MLQQRNNVYSYSTSDNSNGCRTTSSTPTAAGTTSVGSATSSSTGAPAHQL
ncbi:MAG: hypothetical protein ACLTZB_08715 [Streptococcus salivarius]